MSWPETTRALEDLLPEPLLLLSAQGEIVGSNLAARRLFDKKDGRWLNDLVSGNASKLEASLKQWSRSGNLIRGLVTLEGSDGERYVAYGARVSDLQGDHVHIFVRCQIARAANQRFIEITKRVNALNREITRRQQVESQLFAEKELAQVTLQSIGDAVITTDTRGRVNYLNPVAESLTGWPDSEARGLPLADVFRIVNEKTRGPVENPVERVLAHGHIVGLANHTVLLHRDGLEFAIDDSAAPIRDRAGRLIGVVMVFHDVTDARKLADKVSYQASHDSLTGLLNRWSFEHRLRNLLEEAEAAETVHSLMFLDLDQFKIINDTCGHLAGDALLGMLGPALQKHLRQSDLLARLGGDEFGVLLQDCPLTVAKRIAEELRETLENFQFVWEGKPFNIGVSIGQINFNSRHWSLADLLSAADNACYLAKENGRNRIHVYSSDDQEVARRIQQSQWVGRIHKALENGSFCLYCQTIMPISSGRASEANNATGARFELLLRLLEPDGTVIPPMAFIPAAERYGLMASIDQWVIETAFSKLAHAGFSNIGSCAINLSGASLGDEHFLEFVQQCFERFAIPPHLICFEITETEAISKLANARHIIETLKALGCHFSLDDFGSGMSSFGYLKTLPVDNLKIDGAFIKDMADDPIDHAMVDAINNIGHVMGLKTIAEFVETPAILEKLRDLGVDYAQGYGIARPEPFDALIASWAIGAQAAEQED